MITETYSVRVSIPLDDVGTRANAEFWLGDQGGDLSLKQAQAVAKILKTAAAVGEVTVYTSIVKRTVDDSFKPA